MRGPIKWFGGKGKMTKKLLPLIPVHKIYVEVFGGGASLLFAKKPEGIEVYNDLDSGLINFFRVLQNPRKFKQFYRKICITPYSREHYCYCRDTWKTEQDEIERVYRWYIIARMSFSGRFGQSWGFAVTQNRREMSGAVSEWLSIIDLLPEIHQRFMRVQIEHNSWEKIIDTYDTPDTFFYLDPPYVHDTRKSGKYKHEMNNESHEQLVTRFMSCRWQNQNLAIAR